jgi:hypothetical protein
MILKAFIGEVGDDYVANATDVTSVYTAVQVCATWEQDLTTTPPVSFNLSWMPPNMSLVPANITYGYEALQLACSQLYADAPVSEDFHTIDILKETIAIYYWQDKFLNDSWWSHFNHTPFTSQYGDWAEWGFYPTNASNFRCVTENNVYQVSRYHKSLNNSRIRTDRIVVGLLL